MYNDPDPTDAFDDEPLDVSIAYPPLPPWLARRLLTRGERVTWVRGPGLNPPWERYVTNPLLFLAALALGVACDWGSYRATEHIIGATAVFALGSIFVLGISSGYFTRLVVTNFRLLILQGHELVRSWDIDDLPPTLVRYGLRGRQRSRTIDVSAVQTLLGNSSQQFTPAKTILEFGKQLERIKGRLDDRTRPAHGEADRTDERGDRGGDESC
jgi:hypothetical protein